LTHSPKVEDITLESAGDTSNLSWRTKATVEMSEKFLKCDAMNYVNYAEADFIL